MSSCPITKNKHYQRIEIERRRISRDTKCKKDYVTFMNDLLLSGYAQKVTNTTTIDSIPEGKVWYLPHNGAYHPQKQKIELYRLQL